MAIGMDLLSLNDLFNHSEGNKVILNELNTHKISDQQTLSASIMTVYDNADVINTRPRCDCGSVVGVFRTGLRCNSCGTICRSIYEKIEPIVWLKAHDKTLRFLNPAFWNMFTELLGSKDKCDWLRWLCDATYDTGHAVPPVVEGIYLDVLGSRREYGNTMNKLRNVILYLLNLPKSRTELEYLLKLYDKYLHEGSLFSDYIPIVNKTLFVMEKTSKGKFINLVVSDILDIVLSWIKSANNFDRDHNLKKAGNITAMAISALGSFFLNFTTDYILQKSGIFRKHIYGTRGHFTFRAVITSIPGPHLYDEIHVPWCIGVTAFRPHIMAKLEQRGYRHIDMKTMLAAAVKAYHPVIDEILQELLREAPEGKIPVIGQRNPSLSQSSALYLYITQFKTDMDDKTVSISGICIKYPNGEKMN